MCGKQVAQGIRELRIGSRVGARVAPDRFLIHHHHLQSGTVHPLTADRLAGIERGRQHIFHQGALAGAGYPCHHGQPADRYGNIDIFKISQAGSPYGEELLRIGACFREQAGLPAAEKATGGGFGLPQAGRRDLKQDLSTVGAGAGSQVNGLVCIHGSQAFMLHKHHRPGQPAENRNQTPDIGRVLPDGGFIQNVQHIFQPAGERHCQSHPLGFTARQAG